MTSALGSGPARALVAEEEAFQRIGYREDADFAVLAVETDELPDEDVASQVAERTGVPETGVFLPSFATASVTGSVVAAARAAERLSSDWPNSASTRCRCCRPAAARRSRRSPMTKQLRWLGPRRTRLRQRGPPHRRRVLRPVRRGPLRRGPRIRRAARGRLRGRGLGLRGTPRRTVRSRCGHHRRGRRRHARGG